MSETAPPAFDPNRQLEIVRRTLAKRSFCILATSSAANVPHAVGLLYAAVDFDVYLLIGEDTVKARNIRQNPRVAVCVPVRTFPVGPPMAVQFQGTAQLLAPDDPEIVRLLQGRRLKKIAGFGALEKPGITFVRIRPNRRISTYGLGVPLRQLLRDVTQGARRVEIP
jgi:nitroimidazol reductase NimA-like FMN-containing flavoprotein (pyridoxamine 5'-phosphate oxidase superfamily)